MDKEYISLSLYNRILLLRYSDFRGIDTIKEHKKMIKENGFCWWAKIGKRPTEKYLEPFIKQDNAQILLYTPGSLFLCRCGGIIFERPKDNYPNYYLKNIFGTELEPDVFFKLESLQKVELSILEDYIVSSSGKEVFYDLKNTISSYMYIQHKDVPIKQKKQRVKKEKEKSFISEEEKRSCVYRNDGICNNKRSVNYLFECYRPESCIKQKIKKTC